MSSASTGPFFGKKWALTITGPANSQSQTQTKMYITSEDLDQPLRVTFDVVTVWYSWYWQATIKIYNMSQDATKWILSQGGASSSASSGPTLGSQSPPIQQGMRVTLEAGYQYGAFGIIWDGYVLQPMFDRENSTDFVITLNCVAGLNEDARNFINQVYPAGIDPLAMVQQMAADCFHPITVGRVAPTLSAKPLSYPKTVFGNVGSHFDAAARTSNVQWWLDARGFSAAGTGNPAAAKPNVAFQMGDLIKEFPSTAKYTFQVAGTQPTQTNNIASIIGTPQQTQFGVNFRVLMNPNVFVSNPAMAVAIDNSVVIAQLQRQVGDITSIGILAQNGTYGVVGARYIGDTRGSDWYTDITGFLGQGYIAALAAFGQANSGAPNVQVQLDPK